MAHRKFRLRSIPHRAWLLGASLLALGFGSSGCVDDPDCGICDPDNLYLQSVTGLNYSGKKIHLLTTKGSNAACDGGNCPATIDRPKFFVKDLIPCAETEEALASGRPDEYCKVSPLMTFRGIQFVFNNLLDPTSIEVTRKHPEQPTTREIYDWKSRIAKIEGPITRYNGDYVLGANSLETSVRSLNLTCIERLKAQGTDVDAQTLLDNPGICDELGSDGNPLRMDDEGVTKSFRGETDTRMFPCTPGEEVNTCCDHCNYELGVNVAKYGVDESGKRRTPESALSCGGTSDSYIDCTEFVADVNRDLEVVRYSYAWPGSDNTDWRLPRYDKMREVHPKDRPEEYVRRAIHCSSSADCDSSGLPGAACVGRMPDGDHCNGDFDNADCKLRMCEAEWFVECKTDNETTGTALCVDRRFKDRGAGACYVATDDFKQCSAEDPNDCSKIPKGERLSNCDAPDFDNKLTAQECCQASLGGESRCDPLFQPNVEPIDRYDRSLTIIEEKRECFCGPLEDQPESCKAEVDSFCTKDAGGDLKSLGPNAGREDDPESNAGAYTTRFISEQGGVLYDPALKGVEYRPADAGAPRRALVEECASAPGGGIGGRNYLDGWRRNDMRGLDESLEDFDRAMCSGSEYEVQFETGGDEEFVRDKRGNTLAGRSTYIVKTPQFHVEPESGYPATRRGMGSCEFFFLSFSNKFDLSPHNLNKIAVYPLEMRDGKDGCDDAGDATGDPNCWQIPSGAKPAAGGQDCVKTKSELIPGENAPCIEYNVQDQGQGRLWMQIPTEFGKVFQEENQAEGFSGRYRVWIPALGASLGGDLGYRSLEHLKDSASGEDFDGAYRDAFLDVCGMPLIAAPTEDDAKDDDKKNPIDHIFDLRIKTPSCKEDKDFDAVELTCDNAPQIYNPRQWDADRDGVGDAKDLCSTVPGDNQKDDPDKDGLGKRCDNCPLPPDRYNEGAEIVDPSPPPYMLVRNQPLQDDFDQDGVGDACDNCPTVANCSVYGPDKPWVVGDPIDHEDSSRCQTDADTDWIGDLCQGMQGDDAAGPVGYAPDDDLDQDGLANVDDYCPRQPMARIECQDDDECPTGAKCIDDVGICNHVDNDRDGVGDRCDSCPHEPNPGQNVEGGMQTDDPDSDFVGNPCESTARCEDYTDPRPHAFYEYAVNGQCCVATYYMSEYSALNPNADDWEGAADGYYEWETQADGTELYKCKGKCDRVGFAIKRECDNPADPDANVPEDVTPDNELCRPVPDQIKDLPGVMVLPPGCEEAMGTDDPNANERISPEDYQGNLPEWWAQMCFMPQWDLDFDGIGDLGSCDLCPYSFDPKNEPFINEKGKVQLQVGKYCNGIFAIGELCPDIDAGDGTGDMGEGDDDDDDDTGG